MKKKNPTFVMAALLLMVIGTILMLHRVTGARQASAGAVQMVTGFSSVAVGSMLLTKHSIAVFFYFCFVLAIAAVQLPQAGLMSTDAFVVLLLLALGILLIKALPKRKRRR